VTVLSQLLVLLQWAPVNATISEAQSLDPDHFAAGRVAGRTKMSDTLMRGNEFIRKVQSLAKVRGLMCRVDEKRGKGSHVTLYFGEHLTILRNPKDELKTGTLHAMCKQLGIRRDDL